MRALRCFERLRGHEVTIWNDCVKDVNVLPERLKNTGALVALIQPTDLARMKPTALFVNTSRAELVAEHAVAEALRAGRPGAAAIDVYESEPVFGAKHELLSLDNVVCTPHLGYVERDQLENYFSDQFERVLAFAAGKPCGVVNRDVLTLN